MTGVPKLILLVVIVCFLENGNCYSFNSKLSVLASDLQPDFPIGSVFNGLTWLGSDEDSSISLTPEIDLWLYGDSPLGKPNTGRVWNSGFPRNSIGIQRHGHQQSVFWDSAKQGFFQQFPGNSSTWLWPTCGQKLGNYLYIFALSLVSCSSCPSGFAFQVVGSTLIVVDLSDGNYENPVLWKPKYYSMPFTNTILQFASGTVLYGDNYLYVVGSNQVTSSSTVAVLMRVSVSAIASCAASGLSGCAEFLIDNKWTNDPKAGALTTIFSTSPLSFGFWYNSQYSFFYSLYIPFAGDLLSIRTAPKPEGPWGNLIPLYTIPPPLSNSKKFFCYAAKSHPTLAVGSEIIFTFACNAWNFTDIETEPTAYLPIFVRTPILKN